MPNPLYSGCGCGSDAVPFGPQYPRISPSGWQYGGCGCGQPVCTCGNNGTGCPIQLDSNCVIYHKNNDIINNLAPIGLNNGATLQLFMDTVAVPVGLVMNVPNYILPFLRAVPFTINTLQQFAQSVDTEFATQSAAITAATSAAIIPITPVSSTSILLAVSGTQNHTLTASVKISATANNRASILSDGIFAAPQTLTLDNTTKVLTIVGGNSVSLAALACGVIGYLGNLATDPTGILDGQYWWNTTTNVLKIQANGIVRTITTT